MDARVLAFDYDGTVARHGVVADATVEALRRWRDSGRSLLLVTGRQLPDVLRLMPDLLLCDLVVAENGGLMYDPHTDTEVPLGPPVREAFVEALRRRDVSPMSAGRVVIGTWETQVPAVRDLIDEWGIDLRVIMNKGSVMVLPAGVDKASGLRHALQRLGRTTAETVAVGDAENDIAFMRICALSAAVGNALPEVKEQVDVVLEQRHGAGVAELIDGLLTGRLPPAAEPPLAARTAPAPLQSRAHHGPDAADAIGEVVRS